MALLLVVGIITAIIVAGYPGSAEPGEPPQGVLVSGDESQAGCTSTGGCPEGVRDIEVYKLNMPVPSDAITVSEGSTMIFDRGRSGEGFPYCETSSLTSNDAYTLDCEWNDGLVEIPANLPPGEYGMAVSITPETGDGASFYGFHLLVE